MKLHIVGGFLGSGKTTAILAAAKSLIARGLKVGIITNDQGRYLVDTAFFRLADFPAVEVTGGCFCCNYDDLDARLNELIAQSQPDVIFAELVGSCADLVATVVQPLLTLRAGEESPASFTVFSDSRLLRLRLLDESLPFSEDVIYIFDKQIEEAGLLVVNKIDLLSTEKLAELQSLVEQAYPHKTVLYQNSLADQGVGDWLQTIDAHKVPLPQAGLDIDYQRYGAGEARMAWLDEEVTLLARPGAADVTRFIEEFLRAIQARKAGIGHLKFMIQSGDAQIKLSIPAVEEPGWQARLAALPAGPTQVLVNARLEMDATALHDLLTQALNDSGVNWKAGPADYFHPKRPNPTHRMTATAN